MIALLLLAQVQAAAMPPVAHAGAIHHGRGGATTVAAVASDDVVTIDGRLDEPVWRRAALLTGFSLYRPMDQQPAPDSTEVLVWHSRDAVYFGIRAFEPHGAVRATLADRDRISGDDRVEIHLDTFDERRRTYVFIVNPLGVQADGTKSEGGGFIPGSNVFPGQTDLSPDFQWESRGRVTDWGYEVEVRIPFRSLRVPAGAAQTWGLQVVRHVQHSGYELTWTPARAAAASFIAQAGRLEGIAGIRRRPTYQLNPEVTTTVAGAPAGPGWTYQGRPEFGGNFRMGLGSGVVNATVNPDFSQVEADALQIAADPRFALFYPEKRPFFVDGIEQFNVPNTLVYTRRIVRPRFAARASDRLGRTDVAVLTARDRPGGALGDARVEIVRLRRDIGEQSSAGLLYSGRSDPGDANRLFGADARLVFGGMYWAQFQAVGSGTWEEGEPTRTGPMWNAVLDRTGRSWGFHYNLLGIHHDFHAANGFVPRAGIVRPSMMNRFTAYGAPGSVFERYNAFVSTNATWRYSDFFAGRGRLEDQASVNNGLTFRGGWVLNVTPAVATYRFGPDDYAFYYVEDPATGNFMPYRSPARLGSRLLTVGVSTPRFRRVSASAGAGGGHDVNFAEASGARRFDVSASMAWRPSDALRVDASYVSSVLTHRADGARVAVQRIPRLRTEYQLARPLFVRLVGQYEALRREAPRSAHTGQPLHVPDGPFFVPAGGGARNHFRVDGLIAYRPNPGTVLFLGYGSGLDEPRPLAFDDLRRTDDAFFVKASYLFGR